MGLTTEQQDAANAIHHWMKSNNPDDWFFSLHGFAGTGKTFLLQYLVNQCYQNTICCAPTGKAASVLRGKLGIDVTTVHSLLYSPQEMSTKKYEEARLRLEKDKKNQELIDEVEELRLQLVKSKINFEYKDQSATNFKGMLVACDEASMTDLQMRDDFQSTGAKVLFVGDGGQLPNVGGAGWFINNKPDFTLNEVQRQALESPIIRLSMEIREGRVNRSTFKSGDCRLVDKTALCHQDWLDADQIITGRNATRMRLNKWFRRKNEFTNVLPMAGEKLICLKNGGRYSPFINGVQFNCIGDGARMIEDGNHIIDVEYDGSEMKNVPFYDYHVRRNYDQLQKEIPFQMRRGLFELDYGYAITCHKSQGSEWDSVIICDDKMQAGNLDFRKRWLYTAVTRAKEKLLWVKD